MLIYKITNLINNKVYIGQTINSIKRRWKEHNYTYTGCHKLSRAIKKYGKDSFKIEMLEKCDSRQQLNERESYWINYYNSVKEGYNICLGASGIVFTQETKNKMSKSQQKRGVPILQYNEFNEFIQEFACIANAARFLKNVKQVTSKTSVIASNLRATCKRLRGLGYGFKWKFKKDINTPFKEEYKPIPIPKLKKVLCIKPSGDICIFSSIREAASSIEDFPGNITRSAKSGYKVKGCIFKYIEENK